MQSIVQIDFIPDLQKMSIIIVSADWYYKGVVKFYPVFLNPLNLSR